MPPLREGSGESLGRLAMPVLRIAVLLTLSFTSVMACEQMNSFDEDTDPGQSAQTLSQDSSNQVRVEIRINHPPVITGMNAERVDPRTQRLSVQVSEPDGDSLFFAWTTGCSGLYDDPQAAQPLFVHDLPMPAMCDFRVVVSDGVGGTHAGILTVPSPL